MKRAIAALLALGLSSCSAAAQAKGPKLIVAITVDQLSAEIFNQYRPHFTGGFRRLSGGIVFSDGYQAHGTTETCAGYATVLTGNHPARSGIIANNWVDFSLEREEKTMNCVEDASVARAPDGSYTVSSVNLRVPTLGDRMKAATPASRVVAVAGKDRAAAIPGGRSPDQRWWWSNGRFVQNNAAHPAPVAEQVNAAIAGAIARERAPLVPGPACEGKDRAVSLAGVGTVGAFRFQRRTGDSAAFARGPEMDAATLALAAALVQQLQLGRGEVPDLLSIGLSATDYVGHRYGNQGVETCLQLMSLDSDLGGFLTFLDRSGIDYAVVLTADHGVLDLPERQRQLGRANAARLDKGATAEAIGAEVARRLALPEPVFQGDFYLSDKVPAARRSEVLQLATQLLRAHPQVEGVWTKSELAAHPLPAGRAETWSLIDRQRASFDPQRSPDLAVAYKEGVTLISEPGEGAVATHGSPWDYDRKVPILFWWKDVLHQERSESAMTVDIVPTLASLIGLSIPAGEIDGRCLDLQPGPTTNCN